jgi:hypothetical protein
LERFGCFSKVFLVTQNLIHSRPVKKIRRTSLMTVNEAPDRCTDINESL